MSNSIGVVSLDENLVVPDLKNIPLLSGGVRYTLGGRPVMSAKPLVAGQEIRLVDDGKYGLFTGAEIDAINIYRAAATVVDFVHHTGTWKVVVTAVDVDQVDGYANPGPDSLYNGTITMIIAE